MNIEIKESWRTEDGKYDCPICKKDYALTALIGHMKRAGCWEMIQTGQLILDENGNYIINPEMPIK